MFFSARSRKDMMSLEKNTCAGKFLKAFEKHSISEEKNRQPKEGLTLPCLAFISAVTVWEVTEFHCGNIWLSRTVGEEWSHDISMKQVQSNILCCHCRISNFSLRNAGTPQHVQFQKQLSFKQACTELKPGTQRISGERSGLQGCI